MNTAHGQRSTASRNTLSGGGVGRDERPIERLRRWRQESERNQRRGKRQVSGWMPFCHLGLTVIWARIICSCLILSSSRLLMIESKRSFRAPAEVGIIVGLARFICKRPGVVRHSGDVDAAAQAKTAQSGSNAQCHTQVTQMLCIRGQHPHGLNCVLPFLGWGYPPRHSSRRARAARWEAHRPSVQVARERHQCRGLDNQFEGQTLPTNRDKNREGNGK